MNDERIRIEHDEFAKKESNETAEQCERWPVGESGALCTRAGCPISVVFSSLALIPGSMR